TDRRPVAADRVTPTRAFEFGLALSALSFVLLASVVNVLTALLALAGNLFYVFVYTRWLKRSTPQNIVIGGAAGAVPPLVGWAAATGNVAGPAALFFHFSLPSLALLFPALPLYVALRPSPSPPRSRRKRSMSRPTPRRPSRGGTCSSALRSSASSCSSSAPRFSSRTSISPSTEASLATPTGGRPGFARASV